MIARKLPEDQAQRITRTKTYLLNHLDKTYTVAQCARLSALGVKNFRDGFYQLFQVPVAEYLHQTRMQTGKFLLIHTDKPIKEIAGDCGYRHYKNFITAYRKAFGHTPRAERNRRPPTLQFYVRCKPFLFVL